MAKLNVLVAVFVSIVALVMLPVITPVVTEVATRTVTINNVIDGNGVVANDAAVSTVIEHSTKTKGGRLIMYIIIASLLGAIAVGKNVNKGIIIALVIISSVMHVSARESFDSYKMQKRGLLFLMENNMPIKRYEHASQEQRIEYLGLIIKDINTKIFNTQRKIINDNLSVSEKRHLKKQVIWLEQWHDFILYGDAIK